MSIISVAHLTAELPSDAENSNDEKTKAVSQASSFVDTWSNKYYPWDDYDESSGEAEAPYMIVRLCLDIAKAMYYEAVSEMTRGGDERDALSLFLADKRTELKEIDIKPELKSKTIALDSNDAMLIKRFTHVIPQTAYVTSASDGVWNAGSDWWISRGGRNDDEYYNEWYFYASGSDVEGTLYYYRTFRSDGVDYSRAVGRG